MLGTVSLRTFQASFARQEGMEKGEFAAGARRIPAGISRKGYGGGSAFDSLTFWMRYPQHTPVYYTNAN